MKELMKLQYGSHLYGTNTENSDMDYKVLCLPPLKNLIVGQKISNTFNSTSNQNEKNSKNDVDTEYVPFQTFCFDFLKGQTYALEMAFAVLSDHHGLELYDHRVRGIIDHLCSNYLTSSVDSMIGYAMSQSYKYGVKGKRYEALKTLYDELQEHVFHHTDVDQKKSSTFVFW